MIAASLAVLAALLGASVSPARATAEVSTAVTLPEVVYRVDTRDPVFFITIDDGWTASDGVAAWVRQRSLPVTAFVTVDAVHGRWSFFRQVARWGTVQNHTVHHPPLARSGVDRRGEVCGASSVIARHVGVRPWMLRPPYGDGWYSRRSGAPLVRAAAAACGIRYIVLWNAEVSRAGRITFASRSFRPGDIVLLHFDSGLRANLETLVARYREHGLRPARLESYLPARQ